MIGFDVLSRRIGALATVAGLIAAAFYGQAGLTLAHYDARAHLVVARRILDSITPGWEQIGAVWLPVPHVLNMIPVQVDFFYRTGAWATAISVLALGLGAAAIAAIIIRLTGSRWGAVAGAALFAGNPNVLYLHATPMTEPLLFGLTLACTWLMVHWATGDRPGFPASTGWWIVAACLTRYEAWPIIGALIPLALLARWRRGTPVADLVAPARRMLAYPIGSVLFFVVLSRLTVGEWFVSGGFYVPDEMLQGQPSAVAEAMLEGVAELAGAWLPRVAAGSAIAILLLAFVWRQGAALLVPLAMFGAAALPFYAFMSGHPFRIRYELPIVVASALAAGLGVGLTRKGAPVAAILVLFLVGREVRPFDSDAPMVAEATLDRANGEGRQQVTACLARDYNGETIFASMGSLAHYMHDLSAIGLDIADFLHEGNHPMWDAAVVVGGAPFAGWMLVEEFAEGGDVLAQLKRENPHFADGYEQVCEGGNVTLYRRRSAR